MAKAKATTKKRSAPMKPCPACGKMVHARKTACDCGHTFVKKENGTPSASAKKKAASGGKHDAAEMVSVVKKLVETFGTLDHSITALQNAQKASQLVSPIGGVDDALSLLQSLRDATAS